LVNVTARFRDPYTRLATWRTFPSRTEARAWVRQWNADQWPRQLLGVRYTVDETLD
jgi:hypothetical protein